MSEETFTPTADDIFSCDDSSPLEVTVKEWRKNGKIAKFWLRQLPADEAILFENTVKDRGTDGMYLILIACAVDAPEHGKQIFTPEAIERLKKRNIRVLDRLQRLALHHIGMGPDPDAARKNGSGEAVPGASPSS